MAWRNKAGYILSMSYSISYVYLVLGIWYGAWLYGLWYDVVGVRDTSSGVPLDALPLYNAHTVCPLISLTRIYFKV